MMRWINIPVFVLTAVTLVSCSSNDGVPCGSGLIEATEITVSAEANGRLEKLFIDEGDKILAGEIIAVIDTTKAALQLDQAEAIHRTVQTQRDNALIRIEQAALDDSLAQKEFLRISRLLESGSVNQQQYDRAENAARQSRLARRGAQVALKSVDAELTRIETDMELLKKQLADCRPVSPASGTIVLSYVEEGELIGIGKPIVKIANLDTVWVKVYLPPADLTEIKLGDTAEVDPEDGRDKPLPGTVSWIAAEAEFTPKNVQTRQARADLVYAVKITIPNQDEILKIGMPVSVTIP